ncbi:MAG: hypothetical protein IPJ07_11090 [Acidobacteria bacterium]|nr:hypothetical protein [Acidobacteriota bacterium]
MRATVLRYRSNSTRVPAFYRDPVWSPDGKRIVAIRAPRQSRLENPSHKTLKLSQYLQKAALPG